MKSKSAQKVKLTSYDELFGLDRPNTETDRIVEIPLTDLYSFKNHPFYVLDDSKMRETVESIQTYGVLSPGIVRPRNEGGYEILAGHRRKRGCELSGKTTMPVIIRNYTDDEAVVIMVDTNIQREDILPSEKAFAYKMKYDALKHQGSKGDKYTADKVGETANDSGRTVQRYIRLTELVQELLGYVDEGRIPMGVGEKLSFLEQERQDWVVEAINTSGVFPNNQKAEQLKALNEAGELTEGKIYEILIKKENSGVSVQISSKKIGSYFPDAYTKKEIETVIYTLLDEWKEKQREEG